MRVVVAGHPAVRAGFLSCSATAAVGSPAPTGPSNRRRGDGVFFWVVQGALPLAAGGLRPLLLDGRGFGVGLVVLGAGAADTCPSGEQPRPSSAASSGGGLPGSPGRTSIYALSGHCEPDKHLVGATGNPGRTLPTPQRRAGAVARRRAGGSPARQQTKRCAPWRTARRRQPASSSGSITEAAAVSVLATASNCADNVE